MDESDTSGKEDIFFDGDILEKILYNLISNAFKYSENNGIVFFKIENSSEGLLKFKVENSSNKIFIVHRLDRETS